jgi:hypothetical protein
LGYYLPPNSDELFLRFEARPLSGLKTFLQFQMIRHGADFGYGAVPGSSLRDILTDPNSQKYFLMDGVYRWENILSLGGSWGFKIGSVPVAFFMETGWVNTRFSINASAWRSGISGIGFEAEYNWLNDSVYRMLINPVDIIC